MLLAGPPRMSDMRRVSPIRLSEVEVDAVKDLRQSRNSPKVEKAMECKFVLESPAGSAARHRMPCESRMEFLADGSIAVYQTIHPPGNMPPLARVGVRTAFPSDFAYTEWLGLGPHEAYDDRCYSARLGRFALQVDELHTPYVVPQENGHRLQPR